MSVSIRWMGGAGFIIGYNGICAGIDIYLSNSCMNSDGSFKRLIPIPEDPRNLQMNYLIATHEHGDHFDRGCIGGWFADNKDIKLIGPDSVFREAKNVPENQKILLNKGDSLTLGTDMSVDAVFCDHGSECPGCIGVVLKLGGKTIYFTSDTCYRPDLRDLTGVASPDALLVPINPAFGNPGADGAAKLTAMFSPKTVIPCHYWLFKEHGGDPAEFETQCKKEAPGVRLIILAVGEQITI